jgi:PTS system arbutin-like IIC component
MKIMQKIQRFGGAMMVPVLLFAFTGLILSLCIVLGSPSIVGSIAEAGTTWKRIVSVLEDGAWTVFNQMEILFVLGICIGLAKMEKGRAAMTGLVTYLTWNYFISAILGNFDVAGLDIAGDIGAGTGLKSIAGIVTLDTGLIGAMSIAGATVWIHNRYFTKKLPEFLGIFSGSTLVYIVGFFVMIPLAILAVVVWPSIQMGIANMQGGIASSGGFGVWIYTFLERILIPTGLHHFIWQPFMLSDAVVDGGIKLWWFNNLTVMADSSTPLKELAPFAGFSMQGMSKVFGSLGIAAAIYLTSKPEKRKKTLAILLPVTLTAVLTGITEPLEFTFLFVAPMLFGVHALLAATMSTVMYQFGVVGEFGDGILAWISTNYIPLARNHGMTYVVQWIVGLIFSGIYFGLFTVMIRKFNLATPGREAEDADVKLYTKQDYKDKIEQAKAEGHKANAFTQKAMDCIQLLGGKDNLIDINNCATRLRLSVKEESLVGTDAQFKAVGCYGLVKRGGVLCK